jgi:hypothetical protein
MTRKIWPGKKPLPHFATYEDEIAFWERYDVAWDEDGEWGEVTGPDTATTATKAKRVTVTLSAADEARLRRLAKRQHVSKAQALKAIIGGALRPPARPTRRKRAANA